MQNKIKWLPEIRTKITEAITTEAVHVFANKALNPSHEPYQILTASSEN